MVINTSAQRRIASGTGNSRGFGAALLLLLLTATTAGHAGTPYQEARPLMGTLVGVTVEGGPADVREKVDAAWREMARLSDLMNHYNPDSVVSEINRQAGQQPVKVPPELMEVLVMARRVSGRTGGAFDITVGAFKGWRFNPENPAMPSPQELAAALPLVDYRNVILDEKNRTVLLKRPGMRIDLGGIAKLYILNAGMQVLQRHGIGQAMLNGGGDVVVTGTHAGRPWRIGIRHPRRPGELLATVELKRGWVVTSGDYERYFIRDGRRYHHILDPRTGFPAAGPQQVTLVGEELSNLNGFSSAIMVLGTEKGRELLGRLAGVEALIVEPDGRVWLTPGSEARFKLLNSGH
ncbi:MAG TPA: FAD:protein FMN transferase [Sulfuricaulis sp.]|nr:FAD:protein FMN transferase [Sulfuricaulis sp.]